MVSRPSAAVARRHERRWRAESWLFAEKKSEKNTTAATIDKRRSHAIDVSDSNCGLGTVKLKRNAVSPATGFSRAAEGD
jgi:hypothetical protein